MKKKIINKVISTLIFFFVLSIICFMIIRMAPGDTVRNMLGADAIGVTPERLEELREGLGLNDPIFIQYINWLMKALRLDFGTSMMSGRPVLTDLMLSLHPTIVLTFCSVIFMVIISIPLAVLAAKFKDSVFDKAINGFCMAFTSIPCFWLGLVLMQLFAVKLNLFPASGNDGLASLFLPSLTIALNMCPQYIKLLRENLIDSMQKDFVRSARARGISEREIYIKHIFRDSIMPVLTIFGVNVGNLLGGAVVTEVIFGYPGIGKLAIDSINKADYTVLQGFLVILGIIVFVINNFMDFVYGIVDPSIRLKEGGSN